MRTIIYRHVKWVRNQDPIVDAVRTVVKSDEKLKNSQVHAISGIATATLDNWFDGVTQKPQNATVTQVTAALGYVRRDTLDRDGHVVVGFVKARDLDYKDEIEKQADFMLKHADPKTKARLLQRKKKKKNGSAK